MIILLLLPLVLVQNASCQNPQRRGEKKSFSINSPRNEEEKEVRPNCSFVGEWEGGFIINNSTSLHIIGSRWILYVYV